MGRGHRGLCHGSEERARRAFLRPQARLGKLSLLLFGKRIRSQADSRQGRGRASLHGLRAAQLGRVSRTNHRRPQDLGQGQTQGRSSGSAYRHRVQHQGLPADHSGLRLDEGRKAHRRGPSSRGQLSLRGLDFPPPTLEESNNYLGIVKDSVQEVGKENGVFMGLSAVFLDRDALFRPELVRSGKPDGHGRIMLRDWELGLALNHALSSFGLTRRCAKLLPMAE